MISETLLKVLVCPESHQPLKLADPGLIAALNQQIASGALLTRGGHKLADSIDAGLIRRDGKFLYAIRRNIPIMLIDEAIPLARSQCELPD